MSLEILKSGALIEVPSEVAVCPICRGKLYVSCDSWFDEDGEWLADSINMGCETEPDIDSGDWGDWVVGHYSMPYVDWLPVEKIILDWLNKNYRWEI